MHPSVEIFGEEHVVVGSPVRIDAFALITAGPGTVRIGDHVHISAGAYVFGTAGATLGDFVNLSARSVLMTASDDFGDGSLVGPMVPDAFRNVRRAPIHLESHVVIGVGSVVLPGVTIGRGATVGALSVVKHDVPDLAMVAGVPARRIGRRDGDRLLALERRLREDARSR
jgi:acetyltransferase-like isoleucine patch superfamily enzyme